MKRTVRILLNAFLPPLIASFLWALIESAHTSLWADFPLLVLAMALYAYLFSGIFCLVHASVMEATYLKFSPSHPLPMAISTLNGFLTGAALSLLITRDIFASAVHNVPLSIIGAATGLILGRLIAFIHRNSSRKRPSTTIAASI